MAGLQVPCSRHYCVPSLVGGAGTWEADALAPPQEGLCCGDIQAGQQELLTPDVM